MTISCQQFSVSSLDGLNHALEKTDCDPQLILAFGSSSLFSSLDLSKAIKNRYPESLLCGCTTAGVVMGTQVLDDTISVSLIKFEKTIVRKHTVQTKGDASSRDAGREIANALLDSTLRHLLVFSDGLNVNGSALVEGLREVLPSEVAVTGGLAADGSRFKETFILSGSQCRSNLVVGIGFYGSSLQVGFGSLGGWDSFGPVRTVTRSEGNILFELDGKPALDLYMEYLGERAVDLPSSGLLFPLTVKLPGNEEPLVRTLLGIDKEKRSLTFAGDVPNGCQARLMRANLDRLVDGAASAANIAALDLCAKQAQFAVLISCVGRRLVLGQSTEEELDAVREHLGAQAVLTGFYSYGEIAPFIRNARCELHNQTMTITAFAED